jgi:hypothetical protein
MYALGWNPWHSATAMEFGSPSVSVFDVAVTMQGTSPHQWLGLVITQQHNTQCCACPHHRYCDQHRVRGVDIKGEVRCRGVDIKGDPLPASRG